MSLSSLRFFAVGLLFFAACDDPAPQKKIPAEPTETGNASEPSTPNGDEVTDLIRWLLDDEDRADRVPFRSVVKATTGKEIIPFEPDDPVCDAISATIRTAMGGAIEFLNAEKSPVRGLARINEVSRFFEDQMLTRLNDIEGFNCEIPTRADGSAQRSGYPDLKLVHESSGRVVYIDPKLFGPGSEKSSLRTFYFEPKSKTNKILHDAHHLLIGIEHDGNDGAWTFQHWRAIDLSKFEVRLKAEFQASNRDLYTPEATVFGTATDPPE